MHAFFIIRSLLHPGVLFVPLVLLACETSNEEDDGGGGGNGGESNALGGGMAENGGDQADSAGGHNHMHGGGTSSSSGGGSGGEGDTGGTGAEATGGARTTGGADGAGGDSATGGSDMTGGAVGSGGVDGTGGAGELPVNGCVDYVDRSPVAADRAIMWNFDVASDAERCMRVQVGQVVSWSGNFSFHPLSGFGGSSPNPIGSSSGGDLKEVTFMSSGTFGFICEQHVEMQGAIRVVP